jgi:hypothetical protein
MVYSGHTKSVGEESKATAAACARKSPPSVHSKETRQDKTRRHCGLALPPCLPSIFHIPTPPQPTHSPSKTKEDNRIDTIMYIRALSPAAEKDPYAKKREINLQVLVRFGGGKAFGVGVRVQNCVGTFAQGAFAFATERRAGCIRGLALEHRVPVCLCKHACGFHCQLS